MIESIKEKYLIQKLIVGYKTNRKRDLKLVKEWQFTSENWQ